MKTGRSQSVGRGLLLLRQKGVVARSCRASQLLTGASDSSFSAAGAYRELSLSCQQSALLAARHRPGPPERQICIVKAPAVTSVATSTRPQSISAPSPTVIVRFLVLAHGGGNQHGDAICSDARLGRHGIVAHAIVATPPRNCRSLLPVPLSSRASGVVAGHR